MKSLRLILFAALGLAWLAGPAAVVRAQGGSPPTAAGPGPLAALHIQHLTVNDGLPSGRVQAIVQDQHGFMWFGTDQGLARYDGYRVLVYQHQASQPGSLSNDNVTALVDDPAGQMWVGTSGGLDRFDPQADTFSHWQHHADEPASLASNAVMG